MLEIFSTHFEPIEGKPDFKIEIKSLSFVDFQEIQILASGDEPSGGPDEKSKKEKMRDNLLFMKEVLKRGVLSVHGLKINGVEKKDVDSLVDWAPSEAVTKIVAKILEISRAGDAEIKN